MERNAIPTSEVLHLAADAIERKGWKVAQGWDWDHERNDGLCLEGGIAAAMGIKVVDFSETPHGVFVYETHNELRECSAYKAVREYLGDAWEEYGFPNDELWRWNDTVPNTQAEVVEVLRATAEVEYAKEHAYDVIIPEQPIRNS